MSLLIGVRPTVAQGTRLTRGEPLGRALGDVTVELSTERAPGFGRPHRRFIPVTVH